MPANRDISNNAYIIFASALLFLTYAFVLYFHGNLGDTLFPSYMMTIGTVLCVKAAIFIKNYKKDNWMLLELIQACAIPPILYVDIYFSSIERVIKGIIIAVLFGIIYIGILLKFNIYDTDKRGNNRYLKKVIAVGLYNIRRFLLIFLVTQLCISLFVHPSVVGKHYNTNNNKEWKVWSEDRTLASNYNELKILNNKKEFKKADLEKRFKLFTKVVDVELNYLGVPYTIATKTGELMYPTVAYYDDINKVIVIDRKYLATCSAKELIKTASHECRHSYQHQLIRLYKTVKDDEESVAFLSSMLDHVEDYINEFSDYKDSDDGISEYLSQYCEKDCYDYEDCSYEKWVEQMTELEESKSR